MHILKPDHFSQRLILATIRSSLRPIHQPELNDDEAPFDLLKKVNRFVTLGWQINKWGRYNILGTRFTF